MISKYKTGKHFTITITDDSLTAGRRQDRIDAEAALDGFYVLRTPIPASQLDGPAVVAAYKNLKYVERDLLAPGLPVTLARAGGRTGCVKIHDNPAAQLSAYPRPIRQLAVTGLGHDRCTHRPTRHAVAWRCAVEPGSGGGVLGVQGGGANAVSSEGTGIADSTPETTAGPMSSRCRRRPRSRNRPGTSGPRRSGAGRWGRR